MIILAVILVVIFLVVILQDGERRIAVQYSQKVQGRKTYGGSVFTYSVKGKYSRRYTGNFASSLMQFPIVIAQFLEKGNGTGIGSQILKCMNSNNWCDPDNLIYSIGLVVYIVLTISFCIFLYIDYF